MQEKPSTREIIRGINDLKSQLKTMAELIEKTSSYYDSAIELIGRGELPPERLGIRQGYNIGHSAADSIVERASYCVREERQLAILLAIRSFAAAPTEE